MDTAQQKVGTAATQLVCIQGYVHCLCVEAIVEMRVQVCTKKDARDESGMLNNSDWVIYVNVILLYLPIMGMMLGRPRENGFVTANTWHSHGHPDMILIVITPELQNSALHHAGDSQESNDLVAYGSMHACMNP
eukprot:1157563-Pelagomonas_calceolata.AAC.4